MVYGVGEKYRENLRPIITSISDDNLFALSDIGDFSISKFTDEFFLSRDFKKDIAEDFLDEHFIADSIHLGLNYNEQLVYPKPFEITDEAEKEEIRKNFIYFNSKYPYSEKWFINRYGKEFLILNHIISNDCQTEEMDFIEKIKSSSEAEVNIFCNFTNFDYDTISKYINTLFDEEEFFKAFIFLRKLNDNELNRLIEENNYSSNELSSILTFINDENLKEDLFNKYEHEFDIQQKVSILETFEDEDLKVTYYNKYLDEIIEYDEEKSLDSLEDITANSQINEFDFLSERVLDSLSNSNNLYDFLSKLKYYSGIKYEYIKDFSTDEILDIIEDEDYIPNMEDYIEVLKTDKLPDKYILDILEDNWEDGMYLRENKEDIEIEEHYGYSLPVLFLTKLKDDDKKLFFLNEHICDFKEDEITAVLESIGDADKMLNLGKKYKLSKKFYMDLVILCDDEQKFKFLDEDDNKDEEEVSIIISSVYDMPKAFDYIEKLSEFSITQKISILSYIETDLYEDQELIKQTKIDFIKNHKDEILKNFDNKKDLAILYEFLRDFAFDDPENEFLENFMQTVSENVDLRDEEYH